MRVVAAGAQAVGEEGELAGRLLRDPLGGPARPEGAGVGKQRPQHAQVLLAGEIRVGEGVDLLHGAGEVGVDLEAVGVRDHEQGRVLEVLAVEEELGVGGGEVLVLALVLEGEEALAPHVGEALAPAPTGLLHALLEGVELALWVSFGGCGVPDYAAYVVEVRL